MEIAVAATDSGRIAMGEAVLHPLPRRAEMAREQLRAVGLSLRREGAAAAGVMALLSVAVVWDQARSVSEFVVEPGIGIPAAVVALLMPLAVWKGEGPGRRGYHHSMPVDRGVHAVTRGLAGLVWMLAAMGAYYAWLGGVTLAVGGWVRPDAAYRWAAPVAGAVVLYLVGTALALRAAHPWRWLGGGAVGYLFLKLMSEPDRDFAPFRMVDGVLRGRYGLFTVLEGRTPMQFRGVSTWGGHEFTYTVRVADGGVWLTSVWLWLGLALALFVWAAYRQPER
ncbi:MAG TPA: hypothetical protein VF092_31190 [Longimicrobium sp.]